MTKAQIEKTYGVKIRDDSFYNPRTGKSVKQYRIYSADGCQWENGLRSMADVERECKEWASELKEIAGKSMSENKKTLTKKNLVKEDLDYEDENQFKFSVGDTAYLASFSWDNGRKSYYDKVTITKRWNGEVSGVQGNYYAIRKTNGNEISSCPEQFLLSRDEVEKSKNSNGDKVEESIKEDLDNVEVTDNTVVVPQPMAVAKEESEDLWQKFLDATEEPKDAPLFGAEDQPVPEEVEEPKAELEESLSSKLTLDESLFENKKTLKEGIKEEKTALRELQKQLRRLLIEIKDNQKSISSYAKDNGNYTNLIDDLYEARNGLLGAIDDIDNLIFEDHQLSSRRNESLKLKEGYSVVDLETGDRFGNYDDVEMAKSKAYRYATMCYAKCAVIDDKARVVCGFSANGKEIKARGWGDLAVSESFKKKLKEANGEDGQLFNGQKDIADSFKNYKAFKANFKPVHIVKVNGNYFVFNEDAQDSNSYIYYSNSKDNIEGWLYGAVQAKNKRIAEGLKKNKKSIKENFYLKTKNPKKKLNEAYITKDFDEFEPWSGAVEVWNRILDEGKFEDFEFFIDDVYSGVIGETELNDLLRFDSDYVYDVLGMSAEEDIDESLKKGKKALKEGYAPDIIADLEDRARSIVSDGSDLEDAIREAIDDGLIYTEDIVDLAVHYGAIDSSIIDDFYEDLFNDMYSDLEDEVNEEEDDWEDGEDDDIDESLKKNLKESKKRNLKEASSDKETEAARKTKEKLAKKYGVSETSIVWLGGKSFVVVKDGKEIRVNADEVLKEASTLPRGGKDEDFDTDAWSVIYWELSADSEDSTSTRNMKKLAKTSANAKNKYERVDPVNDTDLRVYAKDEDGFKLAKKVADAWKVKYEIEPTKKSHQAKFPDERLQMTIFIPEEMLG